MIAQLDGHDGVVALDTPSGLAVSTGESPGRSVTAAATLTLALPKRGLRNAPGVGDLHLADISVPPAVMERLEGARDQAAEGRRICVELIQGLREIPGLAGIHVMAPLQKTEAIGQVIEESGLLAERAAPSQTGSALG